MIFAAFALGRFTLAAVRVGRHAVSPDETEPAYPQERQPGSVWDAAGH